MGSALLPNVGLCERSTHVDLQQALTGPAEYVAHKGNAEFVAPEHGVKLQPDGLVESHVARSAQADRVAVEVDSVEDGMLA